MLNFRTRSIKFQMLVFIVFIISVIIGVISIYYIDTSSAIGSKSSMFSHEAVEQIRNNATEFCEQIINTSNNIAYNNAVQDFLTERDPLERRNLNVMVSSFLDNIRSLNPYIIDIKVFDRTNTFFNDVESMYMPDHERIEAKGRVLFSGKTIYPFASKSGQQCINVLQNIYDSEGNNPDIVIGKVLIVFRTSALTFERLGKYSRSDLMLYLVDRNGVVLNKSTTKEEDVWDKVKSHIPAGFSGTNVFKEDGKEFYLYSYPVEHLEGKIIGITTADKMFFELNQVRRKTILIVIAAAFILSVAFGFMVRNIIFPVRKFIDFMRDLSRGNTKVLGKKLEIVGYSEINEMVHEFNRMMQEIKELTRNLLNTNTMLYETELSKKQSEISYLRSQINPHFLYNTLESIKGLALIHDNQDIWEIAKSLGVIFRYSISKEDITTLEEELAIVKEYIYIQKVRFEERFSVIYDFDDDIIKYLIPKMILQPFIENAIHHGMEPKLEKCTIRLAGAINTKGDLVITIEDDGKGIDEARLSEIKNVLKSRREVIVSGGGSTGIGISNINNRLKLLYGEEYGVDIKSEPGHGTKVTLSLPSGGDSNV